MLENYVLIIFVVLIGCTNEKVRDMSNAKIAVQIEQQESSFKEFSKDTSGSYYYFMEVNCQSYKDDLKVVADYISYNSLEPLRANDLVVDLNGEKHHFVHIKPFKGLNAVILFEQNMKKSPIEIETKSFVPMSQKNFRLLLGKRNSYPNYLSFYKNLKSNQN